QSEVYTPQMIVNGKEVIIGSDRGKATDAISDAMKNPAASAIQFQSEVQESLQKIKIHFTIQSNSKDEVLNIALVEEQTTSDVSRGENKGRKLNHVNVVRSFE